MILVARTRCAAGDFARMMQLYRDALDKLGLLKKA